MFDPKLLARIFGTGLQTTGSAMSGVPQQGAYPMPVAPRPMGPQPTPPTFPGPNQKKPGLLERILGAGLSGYGNASMGANVR